MSGGEHGGTPLLMLEVRAIAVRFSSGQSGYLRCFLACLNRVTGDESDVPRCEVAHQQHDSDPPRAGAVTHARSLHMGLQCAARVSIEGTDPGVNLM
jgi:hypothetical protein